MLKDTPNNFLSKITCYSPHQDHPHRASPVGFLGKGLWIGLISCPSCVFLGLPWDAAEPVEAALEAGCRSLEAGADVLVFRSELMADSGLKDAGPSTSATSSLLDSGVSLTALG